MPLIEPMLKEGAADDSEGGETGVNAGGSVAPVEPMILGIPEASREDAPVK